MYERKIFVNASEIGKDFKIRPTNFINIIQDTESLHIDSLVDFNGYIKENNLAIFLTFRQVDIHHSPVFKDEIIVQTRPYEMNPFFGYRNTIMYDLDNKPILTSYALGSFVDLKTNKPARLPEDAYRIKLYDKYPMDYTKRKIVIHPDAELISDTPIQVLKSHIDYYQHVNNMYYVEFGINVLPDEFRFNRMRMEYRSPLTYGDKANIILYKLNDYAWTVVKKGDAICAVIEFSTFSN